MKLHDLSYNERTGPPCGAVALSVLNGMKPYDNVDKILEYRKTQKPYKDEWINKYFFYEDRMIIYFREIIHFFTPFFHKQSKIVNVKRTISILDFTEILNPRHCYLVATTEHLQIVRNKKVWDTCTTASNINYNSFKHQLVKWFVRLK